MERDKQDLKDTKVTIGRMGPLGGVREAQPEFMCVRYFLLTPVRFSFDMLLKRG